MKIFAVVFLAVFAVACGDDTDDTVEPKGEACTYEEQNDNRCATDGEILEICNGSIWIIVKDCTTENKTCKSVASGVAYCFDEASRVGEGEVCTGRNQGNCRDGMLCMETDGSTSQCFLTCTTATGAGCNAATQVCFGSDATGVCYDKEGHGGFCGDDDGCSDSADVCMPIAPSQDYGTCTIECDYSNLGTSVGCTGGDYCLDIGWGFYMGVKCTADTACSTGFVCDTDYGMCVNEAGTAIEKVSCTEEDETPCTNVNLNARCSSGFCVEPAAACAVPVGFWDINSEEQIPETSLCGAGHGLCGVIGATGEPAQAFCDAGIDGYEDVGFCLGVCEDEEMAELDCGTGMQCRDDIDVYYTSPKTACAGVDDCAAGQTCNAAGTCTQACTEDANCTADANFASCYSGECIHFLKMCGPSAG